MGTTKSAEFTNRQNELAALAKAIGHPARIAILEYLLETDTCVCGDIVGVLPLAQATVSQHLKELKNAGLIKGSVEGTSVCYCLDEIGFEKIRLFFNHISSVLESRKNNCC
jgi:ArsR family transcriptional regulator, arsenate/arsenite/antimonite-responsive transcriptional repressor